MCANCYYIETNESALTMKSKSASRSSPSLHTCIIHGLSQKVSSVGGELTWLANHCAACCNGWSYLEAEQVQGQVPWRYQTSHAHRCSAGVIDRTHIQLCWATVRITVNSDILRIKVNLYDTTFSEVLISPLPPWLTCQLCGGYQKQRTWSWDTVCWCPLL